MFILLVFAIGSFSWAEPKLNFTLRNGNYCHKEEEFICPSLGGWFKPQCRSEIYTTPRDTKRVFLKHACDDQVEVIEMSTLAGISERGESFVYAGKKFEFLEESERKAGVRVQAPPGNKYPEPKLKPLPVPIPHIVIKPKKN